MNIRHFLRTSLFTLSTTATIGSLNAGVVGGPQFANRLIDFNSRDTFTHMLFEGGRQGVLPVEGKSYTTLVMSIYNPNGSLFNSQVVYPFHTGKIWFDPPLAGYYTIVVQNVSCSLYGEYSLTTN